MKNIRVSVCLLSLVAGSACAENVVTTGAATPVVPTEETTKTTSWYSNAFSKLPAMPEMPASVAKFIPENKYARFALGAAVLGGTSFVAYKYGKTICNTVANVTRNVVQAIKQHRGKAAAVTAIVAAIVAHKYGLDAKAMAWVKSWFVKAPAAAIPVPVTDLKKVDAKTTKTTENTTVTTNTKKADQKVNPVQKKQPTPAPAPKVEPKADEQGTPATDEKKS